MLRYLVEKNKLNKYAPSSALNKKVSLWHGDITKLKIDAIVNSVLGGQRYIPLTKSVFVAVCNAGGPLLEKECQVLRKCQSSTAVVTNGYDLPAKCKGQWRSYTRAYQGTGPCRTCLCPGKTSQ